MYIQNVYIENMGAIENFKLSQSQLFTSENNPKPIILVGKNGTGKTTLLSSIVDALYELSNDCFSDVLPRSGMGYKYFKLSGSRNIRVNNDFAFSYVNFSKKEGFYEYLDKNGNISIEEIKSKIDCLNILHDVSNSNAGGNFKYASKTNEDIDFKNDFLSNSYCYFPSDRYELPYWINKETVESSEQFSEKSRFNGYLDRSILVRKSLNLIKNWILDVFLDSKVSIYVNGNSLHIRESEDVNNAIALSQSVGNIEKIISNIVQKKISIQLNYRGHGNSRIKLVDLENQSEFVPSLDNLSAGQTTLLGIFCTIIQYSDRMDLNKSVHLKDIEGIVVIDEVDLHLHIELQHDVLPNLIKLFPKVQFVITTHSPFFLAGISKVFDKDDIVILNMPNGLEIQSVDNFSEFTKAYSMFSEVTNNYKSELDNLKRVIESSNKPLIITEGKTDWKHLKSAKICLEEYSDLDIDFLEYGDDLKMGSDALSKMIESIKNIPNIRKIIAVFDRDEEHILRKYGEKLFSPLGNNVYAFCIPKIDEELDKISIEYYYSKENLVKFDDQNRRLFCGSEFYSSGNSINEGYQTKEKNKAGKKVIIDSNVFKDTDREQNSSVALSKNDFAENIMNRREGFQNFDFSNFNNIFNVIREIVERE